MTHIPPALIAKAKTAQSAEQLLELAKENNVQMTEAEAKAYFEQIRTQGAVADDDLEIVAGCACGDSESSYSAGDKVRMTDGSRAPNAKKPKA